MTELSIQQSECGAARIERIELCGQSKRSFNNTHVLQRAGASSSSRVRFQLRKWRLGVVQALTDPIERVRMWAPEDMRAGLRLRVGIKLQENDVRLA
jgi:hypothetical protein